MGQLGSKTGSINRRTPLVLPPGENTELTAHPPHMMVLPTDLSWPDTAPAESVLREGEHFHNQHVDTSLEFSAHAFSAQRLPTDTCRLSQPMCFSAPLALAHPRLMLTYVAMAMVWMWLSFRRAALAWTARSAMSAHVGGSVSVERVAGCQRGRLECDSGSELVDFCLEANAGGGREAGAKRQVSQPFSSTPSVAMSGPFQRACTQTMKLAPVSSESQRTCVVLCEAATPRVLTSIGATCIARRGAIDSRGPKALRPLWGPALWKGPDSAADGRVFEGSPPGLNPRQTQGSSADDRCSASTPLDLRPLLYLRPSLVRRRVRLFHAVVRRSSCAGRSEPRSSKAATRH